MQIRFLQRVATAYRSRCLENARKHFSQLEMIKFPQRREYVVEVATQRKQTRKDLESLEFGHILKVDGCWIALIKL